MSEPEASAEALAFVMGRVGCKERCEDAECECVFVAGYCDAFRAQSRAPVGEDVIAIAAIQRLLPPPPEPVCKDSLRGAEREALRIAREAAIWHDKQASAWQDQAHGAYRQIGGSDEAYAAEFRAQHAAYTKYRIIHEQMRNARCARDLRVILGETTR